MEPAELERHVKENSLDQAAASLRAEQAQANAAGDRGRAALAENDLGVVYLLMNRPDDARRALEHAQQLFIELGDAAGQGRAVGNLAQVEERAGNADLAAGLYLQAADLFHEGGTFAEEYTTRRRLSRTYLARGAALMALSENARALAVKPNASAWDKFLGWLCAVPLKLMGIG